MPKHDPNTTQARSTEVRTVIIIPFLGDPDEALTAVLLTEVVATGAALDAEDG